MKRTPSLDETGSQLYYYSPKLTRAFEGKEPLPRDPRQASYILFLAENLCPVLTTEEVWNSLPPELREGTRLEETQKVLEELCNKRYLHKHPY